MNPARATLTMALTRRRPSPKRTAYSVRAIAARRSSSSGSHLTRQTYALTPEKDVVVRDGRFFSLSNEPWLRVEADFGASRFVEIVFRASLLDDPVRPILRFVTPTQVIDRILPGPVAGAGVWIGALPRGACEILLSPTDRPGPFGFAIESVRPVGLVETLARVRRRKPGKLWSFFVPTLFGFRAEAENALDWANNSEPLEDFERWFARRKRPFERDGLDAPRSEIGRLPRFAILVSDSEAAPDRLARTLASIERQSFARPASVTRSEAELRPLLAETDFVARLRPGDELADHALACLAETIARAPQTKLIYADELLRAAHGIRPTFKPDWSPSLAATRPYLGHCAFYAVSTLASAEIDEAMRSAPFTLERSEIAHLRRWLLTRDEDEDGEARAAPPSPTPMGPAPSVSIILLTRDRPDILGAPASRAFCACRRILPSSS